MLLVLRQHCFLSTCSPLLPLTNAYSFFFFPPFPLGYFSSPVEHSSRLSLVHTLPLSHFYVSNYRVWVWCAVYTYIFAYLGITLISAPLKLGQCQWNQWSVCSKSSKQPAGALVQKRNKGKDLTLQQGKKGRDGKLAETGMEKMFPRNMWREVAGAGYAEPGEE